MLGTPLLAAALLAGGCGSSSAGGGSAGGTPSPSGDLSGTVTVLAAASLAGTFAALGRQFEAAHPGTQVRFSFDASSRLASSIVAGADADVFASASDTTMATVVDAGRATETEVFATNTMEIAVPPDLAGRVTGVRDLANPDVTVAVCQAQVPCGAAAAKVFAAAEVDVQPVSEELDVKAVLAKVQMGEVDAGVVYVTDVQAAGKRVTGVRIPADVNASTSYPVAILQGAPNPDAARAFVDLVRSGAGRQVLDAAGFGPP